VASLPEVSPAKLLAERIRYVMFPAMMRVSKYMLLAFDLVFHIFILFYIPIFLCEDRTQVNICLVEGVP
jgi:hypothetical protein